MTTKAEQDKAPTGIGAMRGLAPAKMEAPAETAKAPGRISAGAVRAVEQLDRKPYSLFRDPQEAAAAEKQPQRARQRAFGGTVCAAPPPPTPPPV